jgi:hypothetical protein
MSAAKTEKPKANGQKPFFRSNKKATPSRWLKFRIWIFRMAWSAGGLACVL